jgi:hypothetical protein
MELFHSRFSPYLRFRVNRPEGAPDQYSRLSCFRLSEMMMEMESGFASPVMRAVAAPA